MTLSRPFTLWGGKPRLNQGALVSCQVERDMSWLYAVPHVLLAKAIRDVIGDTNASNNRSAPKDSTVIIFISVDLRHKH